MIEVAAKMRTAPGKRDDFIRDAQPSIAATRKENGCICYELYASAEDENLVMYFELWENRAALDAHMKTPHFLQWRKEREERGYIGGPADMRIYEVTEQAL